MFPSAPQATDESEKAKRSSCAPSHTNARKRRAQAFSWQTLWDEPSALSPPTPRPSRGKFRGCCLDCSRGCVCVCARGVCVCVCVCVCVFCVFFLPLLLLSTLLGTGKAPQRNSVTKISPNVWVNFLVRFGSKLLFLLGNDPVTPSNCAEILWCCSCDFLAARVPFSSWLWAAAKEGCRKGGVTLWFYVCSRLSAFICALVRVRLHW